LTPLELTRCTGATLARAEAFLPHIDAAMAEFGIDTPARQAAFLSQVGHESGGLRWLTELWGPTPAQERYEGRKDLGNTEAGDGYKYRGRGLLQTTGRYNYMQTGEALGLDLLAAPELLAQHEAAARSAAWYWQTHNLNAPADIGDYVVITKKINGGLNGYAERLALYELAQQVLG